MSKESSSEAHPTGIYTGITADYSALTDHDPLDALVTAYGDTSPSDASYIIAKMRGGCQHRILGYMALFFMTLCWNSYVLFRFGNSYFLFHEFHDIVNCTLLFILWCIVMGESIHLLWNNEDDVAIYDDESNDGDGHESSKQLIDEEEFERSNGASVPRTMVIVMVLVLVIVMAMMTVPVPVTVIVMVIFFQRCNDISAKYLNFIVAVPPALIFFTYYKFVHAPNLDTIYGPQGGQHGYCWHTSYSIDLFLDWFVLIGTYKLLISVLNKEECPS